MGWLDADHPFPTGEAPDGLLARLKELARIRVRQPAATTTASSAGAASTKKPSPGVSTLL
jgi:hypothetical protein